MKLTVLGKSPAWQDAGGACSGYLITEGETALVLDCGNGAFAKLREHHDYVDVEAVCISHMHADHFLDLFPFAYALLLAPRQQPVPVAGHPGTDRPARPLLIVPPGGQQTVRTIAGNWGDEGLVEAAFELSEYDTASQLEIGSLRLRFASVPHYILTHAVEIESSVTGGRLVFSSDCSPNDELVVFARGADLMLIEATLPRPERTGVRGHLTPAEAGEHARRAGAKQVVLTHISDELDPDWAAEQGAEGFGAPVDVARGGAAYEI
jgi:ribonuclease BN (tRNA processing enzyme)